LILFELKSASAFGLTIERRLRWIFTDEGGRRGL
jgi:hypothetical protein